MSKSWIIWSLIFVLAGVLGLSGAFLDIRSESRDILGHKAQYQESTDEYLQLYEQWRQLSPEEQAEFPWGQGRYGGPEIKKKIQAEQPGRLRGDIADLAAGIKQEHILAETLYGANWQKEVQKYRERQEIREGLILASTVSILSGFLIIAGHFSCRLTVSLLNRLKRSKVQTTKAKTTATVKTVKKEEEPVKVPPEKKAPALLFPERKNNSDDKDKDKEKGKEKEKEVALKPSLNNDEKVSPRSEGLQKFGLSSLEFKETLRNQAESYRHQESKPNENLDSESEVATLMSTAPVTENLMELTQEVSAIREFAAQQQDRVRQLQDGYDWNIIKRFCLRVIRCIDNIDDRIRKYEDKGQPVEELEDVRDELIFALESSGVEQFEPELKSSYKGLEKCVEAVHDRVQTKDSSLSGMIARIVKPGYQYVVSDEDVKVVRCSQVMLYG